MATVRIYKVAELLNTSSQEVIALLKRDHGIEVKSASSTIEEVVARQFVDRLARQRNITIPTNASFADTPAAVVKGRKPAGKPEPAKPAGPVLGPPRLIKSAKPATPVASFDEDEATAPPGPVEEWVVPPPAPAQRPVLPVPTGRIVPPTLRLRVEDPQTGQAPPATVRRPVLVRPPVQPPQAPQAATGNLSRPAAPRPGA